VTLIYAIQISQSLKLKARKNAVLSTIIKQFSLINRIDLARYRKVTREEERASVGMRQKFQSAGCECQYFSGCECERDVFDQGAMTFL